MKPGTYKVRCYRDACKHQEKRSIGDPHKYKHMCSKCLASRKLVQNGRVMLTVEKVEE